MKRICTNYEQALALKELGFDEPCITSYNESGKLFKVWEDEQVIGITKCLAPLYQQALRWLRNNYNLYTDIFVDDNKTFGFMISHFITEGRVDKPIVRGYNTYEEAEQACLDKLIEIVKNDNTSN